METEPDSATLSLMILVLHYHEDFRKVCVKLLTRMGFDAAAFASGEEALVAMRRHRPRLVILNGTLDDMSGLELLEWLRKDDAFADLPVYFISSNADCQPQAERLGIVAFGLKPLPFEELMRVVQNTPQRV